jgi:hypothetical protein
MKIKILIISCLLLLGCGSSINNLTYTDLPLRKFNKIYVTMKASSENDQVYLAMEDLKFKLSKMGFSIVENKDIADAIVEFQIGTIRNDPLVGWIADEVYVKFIENKTQSTIVVFKASIRFITPTVKNLISNLESAIQKKY